MRNFSLFLVCQILIISCLKDTSIKLPYEGWNPEMINDDWQLSSPEKENMDAEKLDQIFQMIYDDYQFPLAKSLLVFRNGKLVAEAYPMNKRHIHETNNIQSCTKSITALLLGIAMQQDKFEHLDIPLYDIFPELFDANIKKREISLFHTLTMQSGLEFHNSKHTHQLYRTEGSSAQFIISLKMKSDPGIDFHYNDGDPHLISKAIELRTGHTMSKFAEESLFNKLQITNWHWEQAKDGTTFGAFSLFLTSRGLGKIGQLLLQRGEWNNEQIIDKEYLYQATTNQIDTHSNGEPYGYYFWVYPQWGAFAARGHGGQFLFVAPEKQLVAVYTAGSYTSSKLWGNTEELMKQILDSCK